jgi:hypothetical protein
VNVYWKIVERFNSFSLSEEFEKNAVKLGTMTNILVIYYYLLIIIRTRYTTSSSLRQIGRLRAAFCPETNNKLIRTTKINKSLGL